jgi:hypothetical protein
LWSELRSNRFAPDFAPPRCAPLRSAGRASLEKEVLEKKLVRRRGFLQAGAQHEQG